MSLKPIPLAASTLIAALLAGAVPAQDAVAPESPAAVPQAQGTASDATAEAAGEAQAPDASAGDAGQAVADGGAAPDAAAPAASAEQAQAASAYDLLFRNGTLDGLPRTETLTYARDVESLLVPAAGARDSGGIALDFAGGEPEMVRLDFRQGEKHRTLGEFPASVGNPMILYFVETAVRDMAEAAGGSPFYIRNRVKDALIRPATIETGSVRWDGSEVPATVVTLRPFEGDPSADRMQGFDRLTLTVTMSEAVPGWYGSLVAEVPGAEGEAPVYRSAITLERAE